MRGLEFGAQPMTTSVKPAIFPGQRAAGAAVGGVADADRVSIATIGFGANADRNLQRVGIGLPRDDFDVGEVLAVVEGELGTQQLRGIVRRAVAEAHVAAKQALIKSRLLDQRRAKTVARTGLEHEFGAGGEFRRIYSQFTARQFGLGIAERRRRAQQGVTHLIVRGVIDPLANTQPWRADDVAKRRMLEPGSDHLHDHLG